MSKSKQEIVFHSFHLKKEYFLNEKIKVVYFPNEFYQVLQDFQENYENEFKISEFRKLKMSLFPEIISSHYGIESLNGNEPWFYLGEDFLEEDLSFIEHEFALWLEHFIKEKYPSYILSSNFKQGDLLKIKEIYIKDIFHTDTFNNFFQGYFVYHFAKNPKLSSQNYYKKKNKKNKKTNEIITEIIDKTFELPQKWYHVFSNEKHEAISEKIEVPIPDSEASHYVSYVLSIDVKEEQNNVKIFVKTSLRRWFSEKCKLKNYKSRSIYFQFKNSPFDHFIRFNVYKKNNHITFASQSILLKRICAFSTLPNPKKILEAPSNFHQFEKHGFIALIPYQLEDKGNKNPLQSGISIWGKKVLYDSFQETFPYLENSEQSRIIKTSKISLEEGVVHPYILKKNINVTIELWTRNEKVIDYINIVLKNLNEKTNKFYEKNKNKNGFFIFNKITDYSYEIKEKDTNSVFGILNFVQMNDHFDLLYSLNVSDKKGNLSETMKRTNLIKNTLSKNKDIRYSLIEIPSYEDEIKLQDPKKAIQLGFLETNRITQFFHPIDEKKEKETQILGRLGNCLFDILTRSQFYNQMMKEYTPLFSNYTFYSPIKIVGIAKNKKSKYIYIISKFENGNLYIKYKNTDWMLFEDSIVYLNQKNKEALFQQFDNDFVHFIEETVTNDKNKNPVILFERNYLPEPYKEVFGKRTTSLFNLCCFDYDEKRNPYISNEIDQMPSHGSFLVESNNLYYSVAPKTPMPNKIPIHVTEQESNELFSKRRTGKLTFNQVNNDSLAEAIHLLRNVLLTYRSFVNKPYPIHILHYHEKIIIN